MFADFFYCEFSANEKNKKQKPTKKNKKAKKQKQKQKKVKAPLNSLLKLVIQPSFAEIHFVKPGLITHVLLV